MYSYNEIGGTWEAHSMLFLSTSLCVHKKCIHLCVQQRKSLFLHVCAHMSKVIHVYDGICEYWCRAALPPMPATSAPRPARPARVRAELLNSPGNAER